MTNFARLDANGVAIEVCSAEALATHEPVLAATFVECPDGMTAGAKKNSDGSWTAFVPPIPPAPLLPKISPVMFYMAFKVNEMIAIKASTDSLVKEFFARYMIAYEKGEPIDPNLISTQEGLAYLAAPVSPGPGAGILASTARIDEISRGVPQ